MISVDKVYLLTFSSPKSVFSLQVYDADEAVASPFALETSSLNTNSTQERKNKENLDVCEDVKFGFGIVFRLAGLCDRVRLHYHETLRVDGQDISGYSEVMGTFGRLDHVEKAHYYCPRETLFAQASRHQFKNPVLEISLRTESGVELFSHTWKVRIDSKDNMSRLYFGESTVQVATSPSPSFRSSPLASSPSLSPSASVDSFGIESFVDIDSKELDGMIRPCTPVPRTSSVDSACSVSVPQQPNVLKQVGMWLYGSKLGQYVANTINEVSHGQGGQRIHKRQFHSSPIWLLGTKYDLKRTSISNGHFIYIFVATEMNGFRAVSLVPSKSESTLAYTREAYYFKSIQSRKQIYRCLSVSSRAILDPLDSWIRQRQWNIDTNGSYGITASKASSSISLQTFSFDGLVLEMIVSSPPGDVETITFLGDLLKFLAFTVGCLEQRPLLREWTGSVRSQPSSEMANFCFNWKSGSLTETSGQCLLWDPFSQDWINCSYFLSLYGSFTICSGDFICLDAPVSNLDIQNSGEILLMTDNQGHEYHMFLPSIPQRSALAAKLYVHAKGSARKLVKSPALVFRQSHELHRAQAAVEREAEVARRHAVNSNLVEEFLMDFHSRFWFTYRRDMPRIGNTIINTDAGWGCLVRCGQMMLAEAFARTLMGRGWNFIQLECGGVSPELYQGILRLFEDNVSATSPFGLHAMVLAAASLGHPIGQWFSPSLLAHVCRDQSRKTFPVHFLVNPIENGAFYLSYLRGMVAVQPLVLMVPMRLGVDVFNLFYLGLVTGSLELPQSIGIIGGRPGKSYYIVGHQDNELFYLDPHITKGPPPSLIECMINRDFHTNDVLVMNPENLDPSIMFCFLAKNLADLDDLISNLSRLNIQSPVFSFMP